MTPSSYPNQPYQLSSSSAPPIFASPAPMSSYGSPAPTPYQSPASYPPGVPVPPRSQRPSTSPAQTPYSSYGTSTVAYPGQPIPPRSQRPATTGTPSAPQTPASQSMYGTGSTYFSVPQQTTILPASQTPGSQSMYGTNSTFGGVAPQPSSARPQSYAAPITPGAPLLPYSNLPQQPVIGAGPRTPARKKTDAFVANDPFRSHSHSKSDRPSDDLTFDDIPVPGATVVSRPWSKYDPSPSEIPTSQYPGTFTQPTSTYTQPTGAYTQPTGTYTQPTMGSVSAPPASYPPISNGQQNQSQPPSSVSWRPNPSSPYDPSQSNTNPPLMYPGNSQYPPPSQPIYNRPSSATTSPMPYDHSSQYQPYPQGPLGQQMPHPSGDTTGRTSSPGPMSQPPMQLPSVVETTPYPTGPLPASSSDVNLNHQSTQPTLEPVIEAPLGQDDNERPQTPISRPPTPADRPPDVYPPPHVGYPTPVPVYDPNDPSTFPLSPPIPNYPFNPYYPPYTPSTPSLGMYPIPTLKQTIWSRVGNVFRWPHSRRRHDNYLKPDLPYPPIWSPPPSSEESKSGYPSLIVRFIFKTMPREVYLHFLLRLPSLYFSRVARIFEEADLTLPEIKKMALETASQGKNAQFDIHAFESKNVLPEYERLKSTWEAFIDSVMREWKTFNIISVLLLSCV